MVNLVNLSQDESLLSCIERAVRETTGKNGRRSFYAVTCYFDVEAIYILATRLAKSLKEKDARLTSFYIFVDIRDWAKCRISRDDIRRNISERISINIQKINIFPVYFNGKLFHAKGYGLVSELDKITNKRRGFVVTTSGNLTKRGLGVDSESNIEILNITKDSDSINDFFNLIKELSVAEEYISKQDEFLLALSIFSSGDFYHKWEGGLSDRVRFSLELNAKGEKEYKTKNSIFNEYKNESNTISKDPIDLQVVFENFPKPFSRQFWATYSVDTLLGRWIPRDIAAMVDEKLKDDAEQYIVAINEATTPRILEFIKRKLLMEVKFFKDQQYIDGNPKEIVDSWIVKVEKFRKNHDLIKCRIFNYEKIPELLDSSNRTLIMQTFNGLQERLNMGVQHKGVKSLIREAIKQRGMEHDCVQEKLEYLRNKASDNLNL